MFSQKDLYVLNTRFVTAAVICEKYEDSPLFKKALDLLHLSDFLNRDVLLAAAEGTCAAGCMYSARFGGIVPWAGLADGLEEAADLYDHLCADLIEFLFECGVSGTFDENELAELSERFSDLDARLNVPAATLSGLATDFSERKAFLESTVAGGHAYPNAADAIARLGAVLAVLQ